MRISIPFLLIILWCFGTDLLAQDLYVLGIKGKWRHKNESQVIKVEDKISLSDTIIYSSPHDMMVAISETGTKYVIKPDAEKPKEKPSEMEVYIRQQLLPVSARASSRNGSGDDVRFYRQNVFVAFNTLVLPKRNIGSIWYLDSSNGSYKRAREGRGGFILPVDVSNIQNISIRLEQNNSANSVSVTVRKVDESLLAEEVKILLTTMKELENKNDYVRGYIFDNYGFLDESEFESLLVWAEKG